MTWLLVSVILIGGAVFFALRAATQGRLQVEAVLGRMSGYGYASAPRGSDPRAWLRRCEPDGAAPWPLRTSSGENLPWHDAVERSHPSPSRDTEGRRREHLRQPQDSVDGRREEHPIL